MNKEEARRILGVTHEDDDRAIKLKFRKKIRIYHPDAIGSEHPDNIKNAQRINEAYAVLKHKAQMEYDEAAYKEAWSAEVNEAAFVERNIYKPQYMQGYQGMEDIVLDRGRYLWDPDIEGFHNLLRSLNHAARDLLEAVEENCRQQGFYNRFKNGSDDWTFSYQVRLFHCLANQFIRPVMCLHKLAEPEQTDALGRQVYVFRAFLGTSGCSMVFAAMEQLQPKMLLSVVSLKQNRIMVADASGTELGYLSLEEDELYYIIIPLLKSHRAQIKCVVRECYINRHCRPYRAKVNIDLHLRVNQDVEEVAGADQNLVIAELLNQYEAALKE